MTGANRRVKPSAGFLFVEIQEAGCRDEAEVLELGKE
nr:MAG TPA: hypothetical protein [Caudoviricetes sp.]